MLSSACRARSSRSFATILGGLDQGSNVSGMGGRGTRPDTDTLTNVFMAILRSAAGNVIVAVIAGQQRCANANH